jgi:hypothetical protein
MTHLAEARIDPRSAPRRRSSSGGAGSCAWRRQRSPRWRRASGTHASSAAVRAILEAPGRVIVSGVGKSGVIGRKIAATLTSTGTPATFLHPVEALHGDLGIVGAGDVAILLSKSGESDELRGMLEYFEPRRRHDHRAHRVRPLYAGPPRGHRPGLRPWTRRRARTTWHRPAPPRRAGAGRCPRGGAPPGARVRPEDFARLHPGGALGRKLLLRVGDVMVTEDLPVCRRGHDDALLRGAPGREAGDRGRADGADGSLRRASPPAT